MKNPIAWLKGLFTRKRPENHGIMYRQEYTNRLSSQRLQTRNNPYSASSARPTSTASRSASTTDTYPSNISVVPWPGSSGPSFSEPASAYTSGGGGDFGGGGATSSWEPSSSSCSSSSSSDSYSSSSSDSSSSSSCSSSD